MTDEIDEELEHEKFLTEMSELVEQIVWALTLKASPDTLVNWWYDIKVFGDEPAFTSVLFDAVKDHDEFSK